MSSELDELRDLVKAGFGWVLPKGTFSLRSTDILWTGTPDDALRIAANLENEPSMPRDVSEVAERYGWVPRRINPALASPAPRKLIVDYKVIASDYVVNRVVKTD